MEQLLYDNMKSTWGESNFYNFARSAFDRSRSRTGVWNGDSHANFSGLAYSVASGIRAGVIAFSQWGVDCGGYIRSSGEPTEEVWARWMHFSAWSPVYEIRVGTGATPWYAPYTPRLVSILKETANLHTALFPYIKSLTWEAAQTGIPAIRGLFLEYPADKKVYTTTDAYAFGSAFLVAPIVNPGGTRQVYFPEGAQFLEYFNKTDVYVGETSTDVQLELEYVPVYVREGSIVPTGDIFQGNAKWVENWQPSLDIEVFPSWNVPRSTFEYYDGERTKNRGVPIEMTTNRYSGSVTVEYGALGAPATLLVYGKNSVRKVTLNERGGLVTIDNFQSAFKANW
jgi:alpha-D-xyloside xylohydrolase